MNGKQVRDVLERLEITQVDAARLLGVTDRTSRRWVRGGVDGPVEILIKLLDAGKLKIADLDRLRPNLSAKR